MKKSMIVSLLLVITFLSWNAIPSRALSNPSEERYVPNELIVCFRPNVTVPDTSVVAKGNLIMTNQVLAQLSIEPGLVAVERLIPDDLPRPTETVLAKGLPNLNGRPPTEEEVAAIFYYYGLDRTFLLRFSQPLDPQQMAAQLMQDFPEAIEYAEPNYIQELEREPNDPRFRSQRHLLMRASNENNRGDVRATEAWDITTGRSDVVIAVIDTGADFGHQDLVGKFLPGRNFAGAGQPTDVVGHGTGVSGVAAAGTDNDLDVAGVCWNCRVLPIRVFGSSGGAPLSSVINGINYAVSQVSQGVRVINLSLGSVRTASSSERTALRAAGAANVLIVASAGNGGNDAIGDDNDDLPHYPSQYSTELDNVVAVASSGQTNRISRFSNFGKESVTLAAPGEGIWTTVPTDTRLELGNAGGVAPLAGTSFSAPVVAGIAGLIYAQFPSITPAEVRARLEGSVDRFSDFLDTTSSGGRVNAWRALEVDTIPPAVVTDLQTQGSNSTTLRWTAPGDDQHEGQAMFYEVRLSRSQLTADNFDRATKVAIVPFPQEAGAAESFSLGLSRGSYFVALRAIDNVGNKGPISNVITIQVN